MEVDRPSASPVNHQTSRTPSPKHAPTTRPFTPASRIWMRVSYAAMLGVRILSSLSRCWYLVSWIGSFLQEARLSLCHCRSRFGPRNKPVTVAVRDGRASLCLTSMSQPFPHSAVSECGLHLVGCRSFVVFIPKPAGAASSASPFEYTVLVGVQTSRTTVTLFQEQVVPTLNMAPRRPPLKSPFRAAKEADDKLLVAA